MFQRALSTAAKNTTRQATAAPHVFVFGGNGWVGSSVCRALLSKGAQVTVASRSGTSPIAVAAVDNSKDEWVKHVEFTSFDLEQFNDDGNKAALLQLLGNDVTGVVSCVGSFGSPALNSESMFQQNGQTNAFLATTAKEAGVNHFAYISAHQYPVAKQTVMKGYYRGKMHAESSIQQQGFDSTTILRPGFISGTRNGVPLWVAGTPMASMFRTTAVKSVRSNIPSGLGDFLETPIDVDDVGLVAAMGGLGRIDQGGAYGDLSPLNGVDIARIAGTFGSK